MDNSNKIDKKMFNSLSYILGNSEMNNTNIKYDISDLLGSYVQTYRTPINKK